MQYEMIQGLLGELAAIRQDIEDESNSPHCDLQILADLEDRETQLKEQIEAAELELEFGPEGD